MKLFEAGVVLTFIGMGVVFASLVALMFLVKALNAAFPSEGGGEEPAAAAVAEAADLAPLLGAAVGYFLETERPEIFIPPVRRAAESEWSRRARGGSAPSRRPH